MPMKVRYNATMQALFFNAVSLLLLLGLNGLLRRLRLRWIFSTQEWW